MRSTLSPAKPVPRQRRAHASRADDGSPGDAALATGRVLVVDDHRSAREAMADILRCAGHEVCDASSAREALARLEKESFDVVLTDLQMPGMDGLEFLAALAQRGDETQVAMITAHASVSTAVEAMRRGAFDYLEKPFNVEQLEQLIARALRDAGGPRSAADRRTRADVAPAMIGSSPAMHELRERIAQIAPTGETVLILGESGTGKELVARAIHAASRRAAKTFVGVNCPALSPNLMESELFGHVRGAFTTADAPRVGRFELADGGTLFLDEVTELEPPLQAKLLRVLQERSFERVGESQTRAIDVRVLAASNRDLQEEIAARRFREDLYFRLAVVPLRTPPLRQRREDIPELMAHFFQRIAARLVQPPRELSPAALELLMEYSWPGNVRELENLATRASVLGNKATIGPDELRPWLIGQERTSISSAMPADTNLQEMERRLIEATLERFDGHRGKTAQALGIGVRTLANKLRSYGYAPREKPSRKPA
jgi:DNA-binding NtrC family response regulator